VLEDLINEEVHQRVRLLSTHIAGAEVALGLSTDVPHLPGRPDLLHGGQHLVSGLRDPVGVGHPRRFCGRGQCRRDHRGDGAAATEHG
jgi:hypothetical protein